MKHDTLPVRMLKQWRRTAFVATLFVFNIVSFQNCGSDFVIDKKALSGNSFGYLCGSDLSAPFAGTYHPILTTSCQSCHTPGGPGKGAFASGDLGIAFSAFQLATPEMINVYAINPSHAPGYTGPDMQEKIASASDAWNSAVSACKDDAGLSAMTTPKLIGATGTYKTLTWDLDTDLTSGAENLGGAKFSIRVRTLTDSGVVMYYLTSPTIATGTRAVHVADIKVRINGIEQSLGTTFTRIDEEVPAGQTGQVLSTATMVIEHTVNDADVLAISFGALEAR